MRINLVSTSAAALFMLIAGAAAAEESTKLFNGRDLEGWDYFLVDKKAKMEDVWSVKDGVLICKGVPGGYLCTEKKYENFKLVVEWRWPAKPGNSGVLMRITGEPAMLPNSVEAQLKSGDAGHMYGFQGFKISGDSKRSFSNPKAAGGPTGLRKIMANENDPGEWNRYEITAQGDKITLIVNGKKVNEATGCDVRAGQIGLQSEGGVIHFRKVEISPSE